MIFGSRSKGNYKPGSDVDIAVCGEEITLDTLSSLHAMLEEQGPLPYFIDVVDYTHLEHKELKEHIDRVGQVIWSQTHNTALDKNKTKVYREQQI